MIRTETVVGAIAGVATGYVLWLVAISIGDDLTTVSVWSMTTLMLSGAQAACAGLWGWLLCRRSKYLWAAFFLGLPILPLVLTLAVLADIYL